jgi:hypothetical protein
MRQQLRTTLTWLLAACFGAVSLSGQSLHLLPGCDHAFHGRSAACHHAGEPTSSLGFLAGSEPSVSHQADDEFGVCDGQNCLICHYWAQAKTLTAVLYLPLISPRCDDAPVAAVSAFSPLHRCLFECRGPPSLAV